MEAMTSENISNYQHIILFEAEAKYDEPTFQKWISDNWALGAGAATIYAFVIFAGKQYMENRPRFELRYPLAIWSGILAIFSIMGTIRSAPQFLEKVIYQGLHHSVCENDFLHLKPVNFWCYLFTISKIYELGDTVFIVLRKQPLIFLHYYHHITTLIYVWYSYPQRIASGWWFMFLNYCVHSLMYSYYTLRALRYKVPRFVNVIITSLQILQMVIGLSINVYLSQVLMDGIPCDTNWENIKYSVMMYVSYVVLFAKFFYDAYVRPKPERDAEKIKASFQDGHAYRKSSDVLKSKEE